MGCLCVIAWQPLWGIWSLGRGQCLLWPWTSEHCSLLTHQLSPRQHPSQTELLHDKSISECFYIFIYTLTFQHVEVSSHQNMTVMEGNSIQWAINHPCPSLVARWVLRLLQRWLLCLVENICTRETKYVLQILKMLYETVFDFWHIWISKKHPVTTHQLAHLVTFEYV